MSKHVQFSIYIIVYDKNIVGKFTIEVFQEGLTFFGLFIALENAAVN